MKRRCLFTIILVLGGAILAAFGSALAATTLANPASVLCETHGATVEIETTDNGGQRGICVFPDGTRIDEWAYFRNKHRDRH